MPLNALTLTVTNGVVGRPFAGALGGKSAGTQLRVKEGSAPGFGIINGVLSSLSMPYENAAVTVIEFDPRTRERNETTFTLNATRAALVSTVAADGSITYTGGGSGAAPTAQSSTASTSGVVYTVQRLLGSTSTLSLVTGSNSNLSINNTTGAISAASAIAVGASQTANVREANNGLAVEYPVTITGVNAAPAPTPTPTPTPSGSIGGVALGTVATSGPETGMTMVIGDDFDGALDILGPAPANRHGRYGTTRASYLNSTGGPGSNQSPRSAPNLGGVDGDPFWTGHNDKGRGKPPASFADLITQGGGKLTLKQREMKSGEAALVPINNQSTMSSMIHTALFALVRAPAVIEWEEQRSCNSRDHFSAWLLQRISGVSTTIELDIEAGSHTDTTGDGRKIEANVNVWVGGVRQASRSSGSDAFTVDWSVPHRFKFALLESGVAEYYMDNVLIYTLSTEATIILAQAYHLLYTAHLYNVSRPNGDSLYNISWWRYWAKNGLVSRKADHLLVQVAQGEARTVTLPSQTALWGRSVNEDIQAIMCEGNDPGGTSATNGDVFSNFPAGLSVDTSTPETPKLVIANTLKPGRIIVGRYVREPGYATEVHRVAIEVGPQINVADFTVTQGVAVNLDIYAMVDAGSLTSNGTDKDKPITVTGLPSGLIYDDSTGLLTGTTTVAVGERNITITATNNVGQTVTKTVKANVVAQPVDNAYAYQALPSLIGDFDASRDASFAAQSGDITTWANAVSGAGDLTQAPGVTPKAQRLSSQLGGRSVVRGVRGSDGASSCALESAPNLPISTYVQGADGTFTKLYLFRPLAALTGNVGGLGEQVNNTANRNCGIVRRSGTNTSVRILNDLNIGIIPENQWSMVAWRHTPGVSDVWVNKTKVADAVAHAPPTTTWGNTARFTLFNMQGNTGLASRYPTTAFDGDIAQVIVFNAALTDAQITQLMNDMYTKWSLT